MFTSTERRILAVTCLGHFLSHFNLIIFSALVLPLAGLTKLPLAEVLDLSFLGFLLYGLSALPWGFVGDRWGAKRLMMLFFLGSAGSAGAAAWVIDQPAAFSLALAALGLFSGVYHPIGLGLISKGVARMSLAMGYNGIFGNLGLATAPLLAGLLNYLSGVRAVYAAVAVINLAGAVLLATARLPETAPAQAPAESASGGSNGALAGFVFLLLATALAGLAHSGITVILPTYFELKGQGLLAALSGLAHLSLSGNLVATVLTSLTFLASIAGQYLCGRLGERRDNRLVYLAFHAATVLPAFLLSVTMDLPLVLLASVYLFFLLGMQPMENTLVARLSPERLRHSAYGLKFILTFGVGSLGVKLVATVQRNLGLEQVFLVLGGLAVLVVASIIGLVWATRARR